jgi:acyl dehydratase
VPVPGTGPLVVGSTYAPPDVIEVSRRGIAAFADAIGDPGPVYRDVVAARSRGHRDVPAPPTFLVTTVGRVVEPALAAAWTDGDLPAVMVHRDQRFEFARAVYAGDRLRVVATVVRYTVVASARLVTVRCDVTTELGEEVCRMTTSVVGVDSWAAIAATDG